MKTAKDILDQKGNEVWSVSPDDTVYAAIEKMANNGVSALVVLDSDSLVGIITERDYARKVILAGKASRETPVRDVMTEKVLYAPPLRTIDECLALVSNINARHLPIVDDDNKVLGVVSISDLVRAKVSEQALLIDQLQQYISSPY